jgi:putative endonuclease
MSNHYYVYILSSKKNGTLYVGVTNDLMRRVGEHKLGLIEGLTNKYKINKLVYFETYNDINEAILREKRIKKWNRNWKIRLIEEMISEWNDLYEDLF